MGPVYASRVLAAGFRYLTRRPPSEELPIPSPFRLLASSLGLLGLALACASAPPSSPDEAYEVVHEGFGVRVDLDGWQVYRDAESAPAMLRPAFASKRGPDDPPLFVALRGDVIFTVLARRGAAIDSQTLFENFAAGIAQQGDVTHAIRLPASDDILFGYRVGPEGMAAHSRALVHVADGRSLIVTLTRAAQTLSDQVVVDAIGGIELQGEAGWGAPWRLGVPLEGEPLAGYGGVGAGAGEDPFEPVECAPGRYPLLWATPAAGGGRLYLFGSIHVGHRSFYPFARPIEAGFEGADRLVVEVDLSAAGEAGLAQATLEAGSLPAGQQLSDVVSPELYARLGQVAKELGLPPEMFDGMSPGAAGLVLSVMPLLSRGFDPTEGVDLYFLERAEGKEIVELETLGQQLSLIGSFDETFLRATLDGMETLDTDLEALHRAWRCGDEEALTHTVFGLARMRAKTPEDRAYLEEFNEVFIYGRNREMLRTISDLLEAGGDTFVVVGAAHLLGDQGIPALLRAAGHPVEIVGP